jgi:heme exporter protein D
MYLDPNTPFIAASYSASLLVLGALILWVLLDYRAQRRALHELEAHAPRKR